MYSDLTTNGSVEYCQDFVDGLHDLRTTYNDHLLELQTTENIISQELSNLLRVRSPSSKFESRIKTLDGARIKFVRAYEQEIRILNSGDLKGARIIEHEDYLRSLLNDPLPKIKDLLGFRIVSSYSTDIKIGSPLVKALIENFNPSEFEDAVSVKSYSPRQTSETTGDQDGIGGVHLILRLTPTQLSKIEKITGKESSFLSQMNFEIQLRTATTHAWTIISHDRLYKIKGQRKIRDKMRELENLVSSLQQGFDEIGHDEELWLDDLIDKLTARRFKSPKGILALDEAVERKLFQLSLFETEGLEAYAMYKFYNTDSFGPTNDVSPLWIDQIRRCLSFTPLQTIEDLDGFLNEKDAFKRVRTYRDKIRENKKTIFKDATDWLSKCLIFSSQEFRDNYPFGTETATELMSEGLKVRLRKYCF